MTEDDDLPGAKVGDVLDVEDDLSAFLVCRGVAEVVEDGRRRPGGTRAPQ
jgi:hypothetical protein